MCASIRRRAERRRCRRAASGEARHPGVHGARALPTGRLPLRLLRPLRTRLLPLRVPGGVSSTPCLPLCLPHCVFLTVSSSLCLPRCFFLTVPPTVSPSLCLPHRASHCVSLSVSSSPCLPLCLPHCVSLTVSSSGAPALRLHVLHGARQRGAVRAAAAAPAVHQRGEPPQ